MFIEYRFSWKFTDRDEEFVKIEIERNSVPLLHKSYVTRPLNLAARKEVKTKLIHEYPEKFHREQINFVNLELLNKFNLQGIKSIPVYAMAKTEMRNAGLDKDHIIDVNNKMKEQQKNPDTQFLQQIDLNPYAVFSYSKLQGQILKQCLQENVVSVI